MKLLLERGDIDPNLSDNDGQTPLLYAVSRLWEHGNPCGLFYPTAGHENVIKMLLERGDVDPNSPNSDGRTPLSFAAEWGPQHLVRLLLERWDINPGLPDSSGRTPLSYATMKGRRGVVRLLSDSRAPDCESLKSHDSMPTPATDKNTPDKEVTYLPTATPATLHTAHNTRRRDRMGEQGRSEKRRKQELDEEIVGRMCFP